MARELIPGDAKTIRAKLRSNWVYASPMEDADKVFRIVSVRIKQGYLQVQHESGIWFTPNEVWLKVSR